MVCTCTLDPQAVRGEAHNGEKLCSSPQRTSLVGDVRFMQPRSEASCGLPLTPSAQAVDGKANTDRVRAPRAKPERPNELWTAAEDGGPPPSS